MTVPKHWPIPKAYLNPAEELCDHALTQQFY